MISIKTNIKDYLNSFTGEIKKQMEFSKLLANNRVASLVRTNLQTEIRHVFDRPTPYIINSVKYKFGTKTWPTSDVHIEAFGGKGNSPEDILFHQIWGGDRKIKKFEQRLRDVGILEQDKYIVPGARIRLNSYGNISSGQITQILSILQAFPETGYLMNVNNLVKKYGKKKRKLPDIFVIKDNKQHLKPGIYQRKNRHIWPLLMFVKKPVYKKRFAFYDIAEVTVHESYEGIYRKSLFDAIASIK